MKIRETAHHLGFIQRPRPTLPLNIIRAYKCFDYALRAP